MNKKQELSEYRDWIKALKSKIYDTKRKVALSINSQLLELYWEIGKDIIERQEILIGEASLLNRQQTS